MSNVIYAILVLGVMGGLFGLLLAVASKVFAVEKDERLEPIIEALPGANCGGCGYSGCAGYDFAPPVEKRVWTKSPQSWAWNPWR